MKSSRLPTSICLAALLLGAILIVFAVATRAKLPIHIVSVVAASAVAGLFVMLLCWLGGRRWDAWLRRVDHRAVIAGFIAAVVSGLLYSVVHEFGHALFGIALGGTVASVTWTIFGNTPPHVSYAHLPASAAPWAHAGGYLFPTVLALLLIAGWYSRRRHLPSPAAAVLLTSAAMMLLPNLGCIPELFDERNNHFGRFASYYGMGGSGEVLVSLAFAGASTAILVAVLFALKSTSSAARE